MIPLTLGLGCDFHLSYDNVKLALANPARFSINGLGYLLVEVPDYGLPPGLTETFFELRLAGLTPILTHPERNATLQHEPQRLIEWLRAGVLIQMTADALTGHKGKRAQQVAHDLLEKRWVHFLAKRRAQHHRAPAAHARCLHHGWQKVRRRLRAQLVLTNPLAAFLGKDFEVEEGPRGLEPEIKVPGWWQRMAERLKRR